MQCAHCKPGLNDWLENLKQNSTHRWAQLTQKLASLTAIRLIENISFANANLISQVFR